MYRDDQQALQHRVDSVSREADALRRENEAIRAAVGQQQVHSLASLPPGAIYNADVRSLPVAERARLAGHTMRRFPVWAVAVLNVVTFGIFPFIHFGLMHDRMPRAAYNDPSAGKAIGFQFIPYYNLYWIFFSSIRLCTRLNLQLRLRGQSMRAPKGLVIASCIMTVIPYLFLVAIPIMWTITVCFLQSAANKVAALDPNDWIADEGNQHYNPMIGQAPAGAPTGNPYAMSPESGIREAKAQKLVRVSQWLGWGGIGTFVVGGGAAGIIAGAGAAGTVAALAAFGVVVGAVIGQVGRGMQGRAI